MHPDDLEKQPAIPITDEEEQTPRWATTDSSGTLLTIRISDKDIINFLCVLLNTASTVCIVFANKM
jgi:hypothetical protein